MMADARHGACDKYSFCQLPISRVKKALKPYKLIPKRLRLD